MYPFLSVTVGHVLISICFCLFLLGVGYLVYRTRKKPNPYPPGPFRLPLIGNLHQLSRYPHEAFAKMRDRYGNVIAIDFAFTRAIILNDYKSIKEAFNKPELTGRAHLYPFLVISGGDKLRGITHNEGYEWTEQRRFLIKTLRDFGFGKRSMESLMQAEISELLVSLSKFAETHTTFQTKYFFHLAVVNSLWSIITGQRFAHNDAKILELVKIITDGLNDVGLGAAFLFFPALCKYLPKYSGFNTFMSHTTKVHTLLAEQVKEHKATFQPTELRDVIDVHLAQIAITTDPSSTFYKDEGERSLVVTLVDIFYAGLETTSTALSWITLYLAMHQPVQEKLYKEIKAVVGSSRVPCLDDRPQMPYTEAVIMEVLRISNLTPLTLFHRATKDVTFRNYIIPKDTMVMANIYGSNMDPQTWGDPKIFRPERFINKEDGSLLRHHEAFLGFSTGKRVCLGESLAKDQLFLFVSALFQRYWFRPDRSKGEPKIESIMGVALMPKPIDFIITERGI